MNVGLLVAIIIGLSMVVEFLTEIVKDIIKAVEKRETWTVIVKVTSILIGLGVAHVANRELLPLMGVNAFGSVGIVTIVGLVISAGSTKVYDLGKRLREGANADVAPAVEVKINKPEEVTASVDDLPKDGMMN